MGPCTAGKFSCLTKKGRACLSNNLKCDGAADCLDALDERKCERCNDNLFTCTSSNTTHLECQEKSWVCDNTPDCSDGSDEHNCHTTNTPENTTPANAPAKKTRVHTPDVPRTGNDLYMFTDAPYKSSKLTTTPKGMITHTSIENRRLTIKDWNSLDFFQSWHGLIVMTTSVVCIALIVAIVIIAIIRCRKSSKKARIRNSRSKTEIDDIHQSILPREITGTGCTNNCFDSMENHEYEDIDSYRNKRQQSGEYAVPQDAYFYYDTETGRYQEIPEPLVWCDNENIITDLQNNTDIGKADKDGYEVPVKTNEYTELLPTDECYGDKKAKTDLPSDGNVFHVPARPDDRSSAYGDVYTATDIGKVDKDGYEDPDKMNGYAELNRLELETLNGVYSTCDGVGMDAIKASDYLHLTADCQLMKQQSSDYYIHPIYPCKA